MSQVTVISGVERRRFWSDEQKRALVMAVSAPGANVAEIARQADLRPGQIYRWRRQLCGTNQGFAAVTVQEAPVVPAPCSAIAVEVGGSIVRISAAASPALVSAVLRALKA